MHMHIINFRGERRKTKRFFVSVYPVPRRLDNWIPDIKKKMFIVFVKNDVMRLFSYGEKIYPVIRRKKCIQLSSSAAPG